MKRESHGLVSPYLHAHLQRGDRIEVAAPRGDFVLDDGADPVLLVSAGIGLTPLLAMLHRLASEPSTREVWWIHTTHDADSHAFSAEVADLLGRLPSAHSLVYYTTPAQPLAPDSGIRAGRLTAEVIAGLGLPDRTRAPMSAARSRSWTTSRPPSPASASTRLASTPSGSARESAINPGVVGADAPPPHQPPGSARDRSGGDLRPLGAHHRVVGRATRSVLELAEACDVPTQWSCRTGVCHTCVTAVLSGRGVVRDAAARGARRRTSC